MSRLLLIGMLLFPTLAHAQTGTQVANPVVMVIVLGALALAPFVIVMLTSFVKISVVLSILRNALGTQQVPPNQIITGLAFVLTIFIMVPVVRQMYDDAGAFSSSKDIFSEASVKSLYDASKKAKEPLRHFLSKHAQAKDRELFMELAMRLEYSAVEKTPAPAVQATTQPNGPQITATQPAAQSPVAVQSPSPTVPDVNKPDKDDFQVLIPAFVTSQLKEAFEVGFLIFVPFIVVDMVVANILLAMGMQMLSPSVISLPFKLLLFVVVDGWFLIVRGLVLSYV
ncbi:MAG TPA: flagellar type III secretion system pore protein FliP [Candidatus Sulfotelmatobacter sp.]|jgi:type III secretion protein R|nr:flagellar type III secretion system pore protein FliP [Candidatus Sulfotelmatobacter sp.]